MNDRVTEEKPPPPPQTDQEMLDRIEQQTFRYFREEANEKNGLLADRTEPGAPSSIAVVGLGLAAYALGVERGFWTREEAVARTLSTLNFLRNSVQSREEDATGYRGFYYHFLDLKTGRRTYESELSTMDTALLLAGALAAAQFFDADDEKEREIRRAAEFLYRRVDWSWALNRGATLSHGWKPETGFLPYRWEGYSEALILYALALGSPTHPIPPECYQACTSSYAWKKVYGIEYLFAGPLFIHQLSHVWIDFRGIQDDFMGKRSIDYFENSRRATRVQQEYAIRNPKQFKGYGKDCWGITASDGPGPATIEVDAIERQFYGYVARGAPFGPDDGTVSPWAVGTSLPFEREIVLSTLRCFIEDFGLKDRHEYGFEASFNPTFPDLTHSKYGWVAPWILGLNQGPLVLMIENVRSGLLWDLMRQCPHVVRGLRQAGFRGAWL